MTFFIIPVKLQTHKNSNWIISPYIYNFNLIDVEKCLSLQNNKIYDCNIHTDIENIIISLNNLFLKTESEIKLKIENNDSELCLLISNVSQKSIDEIMKHIIINDGVKLKFLQYL